MTKMDASDALTDISYSEDNITDSNTDDYVAYDGDTSQFDYVNYMPGESLEQIHTTWPQDPAFIPTSITYSLAFIIGVTGNFLVIFALVGDKKARNATSAFLVSLAAADLVFLLVCIPYDTVSKFGYWHAGKPLCKFSGFAEMLSASASILNLTAVSVERYVVIVHPMKARSWFSTRKMVQILLAVWLVALLLSSPILHAMTTNTGLFYNNASSVVVQTCADTNFRSDTSRVVFAWYQFAVMFLLPTVIVIYCYSVVIRVLWISTKQLAKMTRIERDDGSRQHLTTDSTKEHHDGSGHRVVRQAVKDQSSEVREARKQVIKMLLAVIGLFLICWGPKLILNIMKRHHLRILHSNSAFIASIAINLLPYIQSASNPVIYGFMSRKFRQSLRSACCLYCCCCACVRNRIRKPQLSRLSDYDLDSKSVVTNGNYTMTSTILDSKKNASMTSF